MSATFRKGMSVRSLEIIYLEQDQTIPTGTKGRVIGLDGPDVKVRFEWWAGLTLRNETTLVSDIVLEVVLW